MTKCIDDNEILHEIVRIVSRFTRSISCYISKNRLPLGQCIQESHVRKMRVYVTSASKVYIIRLFVSNAPLCTEQIMYIVQTVQHLSGKET